MICILRVLKFVPFDEDKSLQEYALSYIEGQNKRQSISKNFVYSDTCEFYKFYTYCRFLIWTLQKFVITRCSNFTTQVGIVYAIEKKIPETHI